jgi:excisionase family DNA binding protein
MRNPGQYLNVEQLAVVLGISEWTIREIVRKGQLPHRYLGMRKSKLRFEIAELNCFFQMKEGGAA